MTGCSIIPRDGPTAEEIRGSATSIAGPATDARAPYAVIAVTPAVAAVVNRLTIKSSPAFSTYLLPRAGASARVAVGDVLAITVFETSSGGLFTPEAGSTKSGNFVQIPNQQVDSLGTITVPYAGTISVVGRTPSSIGRQLATKLSGRAIEPQVVVTMAERHGNDISVLGDVNQPQRFSLDPGGIKVLGAIARGGGPRNPPYETVVTIQRRGRTERALLSTMVRDPTQNVELVNGDVVFVAREQRIFLALGATPSPGSVGGINNRRFSFDEDRMSLAEAVAKAGGLDDGRADPSAVFLYRVQSKTALREQGVDTSSFVSDDVPTIYTVDLGKADGLFLANSFQMRDRDMIFVSNAIETDLNKFLGLVRNTTGPFYDSASAAALIR